MAKINAANIDAQNGFRWKSLGWLCLLAVWLQQVGCVGFPDHPLARQTPDNAPALSLAPTLMPTSSDVPVRTPSHAAQANPAESTDATPPVVRGQGGTVSQSSINENTAGSDDYLRRPMAVADASTDAVRHTAFQPPVSSGPVPGYPAPGYLPPPTPSNVPVAPPSASSSGIAPTTPVPGVNNNQWVSSPYLNSTTNGDPAANLAQLPGTPVPLDITVEEARTGQFMFGAGINSDAGVTGQITVDERNFDLFGFPTSWDQLMNGEAFRGRGQAFRLEAIPGNRVQRYLVSFTEPYLFWTPISLNVSGFLFDRQYYDWTESRAGGRLGLGYRLTPDLSVSAGLRMEDVRIENPRVLGVPQLDAVLGSNDFYAAQFSLRHDTRDIPFAPTEGHLIEMSYDQAFGEFDYPRFEGDFRKYFLVRERPDGSGRHTLAFTLAAGFSGTDTPLFENYFAGGFSTLRGFRFRGASPVAGTVKVGGRLKLLGSVEYVLPVTADDMIKTVMFCDYGTIEQELEINTENFRVAPGFGFRIAVPALGPAPLAFDFAFPVASADTDEEQIFSFFFGVGRG